MNFETLMRNHTLIQSPEELAARRRDELATFMTTMQRRAPMHLTIDNIPESIDAASLTDIQKFNASAAGFASRFAEARAGWCDLPVAESSPTMSIKAIAKQRRATLQAFAEAWGELAAMLAARRDLAAKLVEACRTALGEAEAAEKKALEKGRKQLAAAGITPEKYPNFKSDSKLAELQFANKDLARCGVVRDAKKAVDRAKAALQWATNLETSRPDQFVVISAIRGAVISDIVNGL